VQTKKLSHSPTASADVKRLKKRPRFPAEFSSQRIKYSEATPKLETAPESDNFFDLAGERILLMGTERGPITEVWSHPIRLCKNLMSGSWHFRQLLATARYTQLFELPNAGRRLRRLQRCNLVNARVAS
jgi:hypothetical protein